MMVSLANTTAAPCVSGISESAGCHQPTQAMVAQQTLLVQHNTQEGIRLAANGTLSPDKRMEF
jgi:hypothetical protein